LALKQWQGQLRTQFNLLANASAMFLITHSNREQLLHLASTHTSGEPFKLDSLMEIQREENIRFEI
jgi:hypothetical protein